MLLSLCARNREHPPVGTKWQSKAGSDQLRLLLPSNNFGLETAKNSTLRQDL